MSCILLFTVLLIPAQNPKGESSYLEWELKYFEGEVIKKPGEELDIDVRFAKDRKSFKEISSIKIITRGYSESFAHADTQSTSIAFGILPTGSTKDRIKIHTIFRRREDDEPTIGYTYIPVRDIIRNQEKIISGGAMLLRTPGKDSEGRIHVFTLVVSEKKGKDLGFIIENYKRKMLRRKGKE